MWYSCLTGLAPCGETALSEREYLDSYLSGPGSGPPSDRTLGVAQRERDSESAQRFSGDGLGARSESPEEEAGEIGGSPGASFHVSSFLSLRQSLPSGYRAIGTRGEGCLPAGRVIKWMIVFLLQNPHQPRVARLLGIFAQALSAHFFLLDSYLRCHWAGKSINRGRNHSISIGQSGDWSAIESRLPFTLFENRAAVPHPPPPCWSVEPRLF